MGKTVPLNGLVIKFHNKVLPTLPGFSLAPITATVWGAKIPSSALVFSVRNISDALSNLKGIDVSMTAPCFLTCTYLNQ